MAKLPKKQMKVFGDTAPTTDFGKFGSMAAGEVAYTKDPELIQSLSNYEDAWRAAVTGQNAPAIEDMNALFYLITYQLKYLKQEGVAEWDEKHEYHIHSIVKYGGVLYQCQSNDVKNSTTPLEAVEDPTNYDWTIFMPPNESIVGSEKLKAQSVDETRLKPSILNPEAKFLNDSNDGITLGEYDHFVFCDMSNSGSDYTVNLPEPSTCADKVYKIMYKGEMTSKVLTIGYKNTSNVQQELKKLYMDGEGAEFISNGEIWIKIRNFGDKRFLDYSEMQGFRVDVVNNNGLTVHQKMYRDGSKISYTVTLYTTSSGQPLFQISPQMQVPNYNDRYGENSIKSRADSSTHNMIGQCYFYKYVSGSGVTEYLGIARGWYFDPYEQDDFRVWVTFPNINQFPADGTYSSYMQITFDLFFETLK